jgi:hypothetical protein
MGFTWFRTFCKTSRGRLRTKDLFVVRLIFALEARKETHKARTSQRGGIRRRNEERQREEERKREGKRRGVETEDHEAARKED